MDRESGLGQNEGFGPSFGTPRGGQQEEGVCLDDQ